ncbi:MAG: signal peptidase II [Deltaproteobacteria bacterium]|nr:signal peptidase II [Deltaproteobacteria bacterium]
MLRVERSLVLPIIPITTVFFINWWARRLIVQTVDLYERVPVIKGFFSITHIRNPGAAFGLFSKLDPSYRLPFLLGTSFAALLLIAYLLVKSGQDHWVRRLGLSFLTGGAIGNIYERLVYGEVVDYLDFYFRNYHWPSFNAADMFITAGVGFVLLYHIFINRGLETEESRG